MDTLTAVRMRTIEDLCVEMSAHIRVMTLTACAVVGCSIITAMNIAVHHLRTTAAMEIADIIELLLTLIALLE